MFVAFLAVIFVASSVLFVVFHFFSDTEFFFLTTGPSGGGKSTITHLIENFYYPTSGYLCFGMNCLVPPSYPKYWCSLLSRSLAVLSLFSIFSVTQNLYITDDIDMRDLDPRYIRKNIAIVTQEPALFSTTIFGSILSFLFFRLLMNYHVYLCFIFAIFFCFFSSLRHLPFEPNNRHNIRPRRR